MIAIVAMIAMAAMNAVMTTMATMPMTDRMSSRRRPPIGRGAQLAVLVAFLVAGGSASAQPEEAAEPPPTDPTAQPMAVPDAGESAPIQPGAEPEPSETDEPAPPPDAPAEAAPAGDVPEAVEASPQAGPGQAAELRPPSVSPEAEAETDGGPLGADEPSEVELVARVMTRGVDPERPAPDVEVGLFEIGPTGLREVARATTDEAGIARFRVADDGARRYVAEVVVEGISFMADDMLQPGRSEEVVVPVFEARDDPSGVVATNLVTLVSLWEGFLVFEQYWSFATDGTYVYRATEGVPNAGIRVPLPEGARGVHIDRPDETGAVADESGVIYRGPITAQQRGVQGADLVIRFNIPNDASSYRFEQPLSMPVENVTVALPLETRFARHRRLDVQLRVPDCADAPQSVVCFPDPGSVGRGPDPFPDRDRLIVHGGSGAAGASLVFETEGWPVRSDPFKLLSGLGVLAVALIAVRLFTRRPTQAEGPTRHQLTRERIELLAALAEAQQQYEAGVLSQSEFESADLLIRNRLEAVYEALDVPAGEILPAGAEDAGPPEDGERGPES